MSDLKGKALQAASEVVKSSIEGLDPKVIAQETAKILMNKEKLPTHQEALGEDPEAEDDRKVIRALGDMADLDRMGEEEKAKLVWEEMRAGLGWKKGKFWGFADKMGEWMLEKAIGWGVLPVSLVTAAMAKRKLREEMEKRKTGTANAPAGPIKAVKKNDEEGDKAKPSSSPEDTEEKTIELLSEEKDRILALHARSKETVAEWRLFVSENGGKYIAGQLQAIEKRIAALDLSKLSKETVEALRKLIKEKGDAATGEEVLVILSHEIKDLANAGFLVELKESFTKDPKLKANNLAWKGLNTVRHHLGSVKKVSPENLARYDALVRAIDLSDYTRTDPQGWTDLMNFVNELGAGCEMRQDDGFYHMVDVTSGNFEHELVGFSAAISAERIDNLPKVFFGNIALIKAKENTRKLAHAFFDSFASSLGSMAPKTKEVVGKIRSAVDRGDVDLDKFISKPHSSTKALRDELVVALKEDMAGGNLVVLGLKGGYIAVRTAIGTEWSFFKIALASLGDGLINGLGSYRVEGSDWWSGPKEFANEYFSGAAPMIAIYGGAVLAKSLLTHKLHAGALAKGAAKALLAPAAIVYDVGKLAWKVTKGGIEVVDFLHDVRHGSQNARRMFGLHVWNNYATTSNAWKRLLPMEVRLKFLGEHWNASRLGEMLYRAQRAGELLEMERLQRGTGAHYGHWGSTAKGEIAALDEMIGKYVTMNFDSVLRRRVLGKVADPRLVEEIRMALLDHFQGKWLDGKPVINVAELEVRVNEMVSANGGIKTTENILRLNERRLEDLKLERDRLTTLGKDATSIETQISEMEREITNAKPEIARTHAIRNEAEEALRQKNLPLADQKVRLLVAEEEAFLKANLDDYDRKITSLKTSPDKQRFLDLMRQGLTEERRLADLIEERMRMAKMMKDAGVADDVVIAFTKESEQLIERFAKSKAAAYQALDEAYVALRKSVGWKKVGKLPVFMDQEFSALRKEYRHFVTHDGGGLPTTRFMRSMRNTMILQTVLLTPILYLKYRDIVADNPEAELAEIARELGPEVLQFVAEIVSPFGYTQWSAIWTGKELFTDRKLGGLDYLSNGLWGTYFAATHALATAGFVFTLPAGGVLGEGSGAVTTALATGLKGMGKANMIAKVYAKLPRITSLFQRIGFSNIPGVLQKIMTGTKAIQKTAMAGGLVTAAGTLVYSLGGVAGRYLYGAPIGGAEYAPSEIVQQEILSEPTSHTTEAQTSSEQKSFNPQNA